MTAKRLTIPEWIEANIEPIEPMPYQKALLEGLADRDVRVVFIPQRRSWQSLQAELEDPQEIM